jgi:Ser/Thr protein kinase RdoA (MazF antagonist)
VPIRCALGDYPISPKRIKLVARRDNDVYRVWTNDGSYAVRHHRADVGACKVASELLWLEYLAKPLGTRIPRPLRTISGELTSSACGRVVSVLHWLPGRAPGKATSSLAHAMGSTLGELHGASANFVIPEGFCVPRMDATGFFGACWMRKLEGAKTLMDADAWALVRRRAEAVQIGFPTAPAGVLHNDLIGSNCLWQSGTLGVIDFANVGQGPFVFDLAVALRHLPLALRPDLIRGYRSVNHLSADQESVLPLLIQARMLSMVTYAAERLTLPGGAYDPVKLVAYALESLRREAELGP